MQVTLLLFLPPDVHDFTNTLTLNTRYLIFFAFLRCWIYIPFISLPNTPYFVLTHH